MAIPTSIGKYQIEAWIGRGGYAVVYHAYDPVLQLGLRSRCPIPGY